MTPLDHSAPWIAGAILTAFIGLTTWLILHALQKMHYDILENRACIQEANRSLSDLHIRLCPFESDRRKRQQAEQEAAAQRAKTYSDRIVIRPARDPGQPAGGDGQETTGEK